MQADSISNKYLRASRKAANLLGLSRRKIFAIGFNKTATTSIHQTFRRLGFPSYHGEHWQDAKGGRALRMYTCFSDGPARDFRELDQQYSGAKFILNVRALGPWIESRLNHLAQHGGAYPGTTWSISEDSVRAWAHERNEYHLDVLSYFRGRPDDFIVLNFPRDEEAPRKLCEFLGRNDVTPMKFHANASPSRNLAPEHQAIMARAVKSLGLSNDDLSSDLLSPSLTCAEIVRGLPIDSSMILTTY